MGLLHEMQTGRQADQLRAQADAQAVLLDAEADILGARADGSPCRPDRVHPAQPAAGFVGCRTRGTGMLPAAPYFPQSLAEFDEVRALLQVGARFPCRDGICAPASLAALAALEDAPDALAHAARFGQYTQADADAAAPEATRPRAWYWVEIFRYQNDATAAPHHAAPDPNRPFVYRITVLAQGLHPGTRAVVKSLFVPYPSTQLQ
ncbi:hypothetical protein [Pseudorhodoferax sp.]|uniref:hypothetical protein n=1 Tax=Pseudorhodoferax sp. TaxID=1993553 RepID=UPI0039E2596B